MENKTNELKAKNLDLEKLINYQDGSVVSREILKLPTGTLTVFAFDAGQGLSEHTAPYDATVYILDGEAEVKISGQIHLVKKREMPQELIDSIWDVIEQLRARSKLNELEEIGTTKKPKKRKG